MKCEFKKKTPEIPTGGTLTLYQVKITPETQEDKDFIEGWKGSQYIEKWIDEEGNVRLLL